MGREVRNVRILSWCSNQPYYTDVEIVREEDDRLIIKSWEGQKELTFDDNINAWVSRKI